MTIKEIIYTCFYSVAFILSVLTGIIGTGGFRGHTHTPPGAFIIELFALPIGIILMLFDLLLIRPFAFKNIRVHAVGLTINGLLMAYVLALALFNW